MTNAHPVYYTQAEYIAFEDGSHERHEYLAGEIYALAGGSPEHARLGAELLAAIRLGVAGDCTVFTSDLRIRIESADRTTYPDASVVCGAPELAPADKHAYTNPRLVVEVTSPSTERYDRGEKLTHYQTLPSVQEILLVSQDTPWLVLYRRTRDGWVCIEAREHQTLELESARAVSSRPREAEARVHPAPRQPNQA
jgi:Uma2 family endonuclease